MIKVTSFLYMGICDALDCRGRALALPLAGRLGGTRAATGQDTGRDGHPRGRGQRLPDGHTAGRCDGMQTGHPCQQQRDQLRVCGTGPLLSELPVSQRASAPTYPHPLAARGGGRADAAHGARPPTAVLAPGPPHHREWAPAASPHPPAHPRPCPVPDEIPRTRLHPAPTPIPPPCRQDGSALWWGSCAFFPTCLRADNAVRRRLAMLYRSSAGYLPSVST
jgi:hypothetical protein